MRKKIFTKVLFVVLSLLVSHAYAETCSGSVKIQYQQYGSCGTQERTCCVNGLWSEWGKDCTCFNSGTQCDALQIYADFDAENCRCICPEGSIEVNGVCECDSANGYELDNHACVKDDTPSCGANECWNGSQCEAKGSTSVSCVGFVQETSGGTLTRTATCREGSGWSYGYWKGTCTCKSGYKWVPGSGSLTGHCEANQSWTWICDHGYIVSHDGCDAYNGTALRGYPCYNKGERATAYEDIGGGQCETASCVCGGQDYKRIYSQICDVSLANTYIVRK